MTYNSNIPTMPLNKFSILCSNDLDFIRSKLSINYHPVHCDLVGRERRFQMIYNHAFMDGLSLSSSSVCGNFEFESEPTENSFILQMYMLHGGCKITHGKSTVRVFEKGGGSIVSPWQKTRWTYESGQMQVAVRLERESLEQHLQALIGKQLDEPLQFHHRIDTRKPRMQGLRKMISFYIQELNHKDGLLQYPVMQEKMRSMFFKALLYSQPNNYSEILESTAQPAAPEFIWRAEEYIEAHIDEPLRVTQIAQKCGIGIRSLQTGFHKYRGKTLSAFIKEQRLEHAWRLLKRHPKQPITDVAYKCGFSNPSYFSAEFKKRFDILPSELVR